MLPVFFPEEKAGCGISLTLLAGLALLFREKTMPAGHQQTKVIKKGEANERGQQIAGRK